MKFRRKPSIIEAEQWFSNKYVEGVKNDENGNQYVETTHGNRIILQPGDWIIREPDGNGYYAVKDHIFIDMYEEIQES